MSVRVDHELLFQLSLLLMLYLSMRALKEQDNPGILLLHQSDLPYSSSNPAGGRTMILRSLMLTSGTIDFTNGIKISRPKKSTANKFCPGRATTSITGPSSLPSFVITRQPSNCWRWKSSSFVPASISTSESSKTLRST